MVILDTYQIRDADSNDVEALTVLLTQLGYPTTAVEVETRLNNVSKNSDYRTLVITDGDQVIGMTGLVKGFWYEKNGSYVRILVSLSGKINAGRGIGKLLIKAVEGWAAEINAIRLY